MKNNIIDDQVRYLFHFAYHHNVKCPVHLHDHTEIVIVKRGTLKMEIDGKNYDIKGNEGVFIPPFSPHSFTSREDNDCLVLVFSKSIVSYFFDKVKNLSVVNHLFSVNESAVATIDKILQRDNCMDMLNAQAILAPLFYNIYRDCTFCERKNLSNGTFNKAIKYLNEHFRDDIGLVDVAETVNCHPVTLSKVFSRVAGVSFNYYLRYLRCQYAATLIKKGAGSMIEIAMQSGFYEVRSFNRAFMSVYNITPTEYKKSSFM